MPWRERRSVTSPAPTRTPMCRAAPSISTTERRNSIRSSTSCTLLGLAIIIALFSIANSMALSIHERTRELGLLRAVGMTRRQTRSAVRWESVLVALLGTGSGVLLGIFFGWAISVTIRDAGVGAFTLPVRSIVIVALLAVAGALLATSRPAHRAARMNVLNAIAAE